MAALSRCGGSSQVQSILQSGWQRMQRRCYSEQGQKHVVVMVRHGQSEWNEKNLFCGWYNAPLTEKGCQEAEAAGQAVKDAKLQFDIGHTSVLTRAQLTLQTILDVLGQPKLCVLNSWRLNERHYGGLTGLNKADTAKKYGEQKVKVWRRSFDTPPPPMEPDHKYYDAITKDPRYSNGPQPDQFPTAESLKLTIGRTLPYWNEVIVPQIRAGKRLIIAAHGNSLRGLVKHLDSISDKAIMELNLPTGVPFVYELDECMQPLAPMRFLGDPATVKKAMDMVAKQGKTN